MDTIPEGPKTVLRPTGKPKYAISPTKKPPQAPPKQAVTKGFTLGSVTP